MRIGLDARTLYRPTRRGIGKTLIDLYEHLLAARPHWQVVAYHRQKRSMEPLAPTSQVTSRLIEMIGDRFDAWQRLRLPTAAWRDGVDLLHCPANACSAWMPTPTVVTIHDLIPLDMPEGRPAVEVRRFEQSVRTACRQAAWLVCPSVYTRDRLIGEFDADPKRITVNAWAADSSVSEVDASNWRPVLDRYGITRPFVLHFGSGEARKNTRRVIDAWAMCDRPIRRSVDLLIVGLDYHAQEAMRQTIRQLGLARSIRLHGFAREEDLPTLLSAAQALVYPSLSEGFGLPILDAWAAGTTVLTSQCTSLPEVAGDAAILVDPTDCCSIGRGLTRLISDSRLRKELRQKSDQRLKQFTWSASAQRFASAIEQAAALHQPLKVAA